MSKFKITHHQRLENGKEVESVHSLLERSQLALTMSTGEGIYTWLPIERSMSLSDLKELHEVIGNYLKEHENN